MLLSLSVSNYILIGSLETSFPEGLIIISGETGAGKSILLGALSLVLGAKADSGMVGPRGETCVVEARFSVDEVLARVLEEKDIPFEDNELVLRRVVSRSGRSRSFAGDEPVAVGELQEISSLLVDIHSQHQTLRLQDARFRMDALDLYAGAMALRGEVSAAWKAVLAARASLAEFLERKALALRDKEYNYSRWERLSTAALVEGELEELEAEQKQLAHAEEIKETLCAAENILADESYAPSRQIREVGKLLSKMSSFIPSLEGLSERLESARLELEDIADEVSTLNSRTEASPSRLEAVESRISELYSLMQKYGAASVAELIAERDRLAALVQVTENIEDEEGALKAAVSSAEKKYASLSDSLHGARVKAAGPFGDAIQAQLRGLELSQAIFEVRVEDAESSALGKDVVNFMFSSIGKSPVDVSKAASGGELSRIMLSLKAMMARLTHMPTLVFDEIDTGVSGSVADKMGSLVCSMGQDMQVFAITHLPQVAAKGNAHYLVSKKQDETFVEPLDSAGRVAELARMLSGSVVTPEAIANAKSLLGV